MFQQFIRIFTVLHLLGIKGKLFFYLLKKMFILESKHPVCNTPVSCGEKCMKSIKTDTHTVWSWVWLELYVRHTRFLRHSILLILIHWFDFLQLPRFSNVHLSLSRTRNAPLTFQHASRYRSFIPSWIRHHIKFRHSIRKSPPTFLLVLSNILIERRLSVYSDFKRVPEDLLQ